MPMKCIAQIAPPPMETAAAASHAKASPPVRDRARRALCRPLKEPKTEMTKDIATNVGSKDVEAPADIPGIPGSTASTGKLATSIAGSSHRE